MGKAWLGYLGSVFILLGGIAMLIAQSYIMGSVLIVAAIAGIMLKYIIGKKQG